MSATDMSAGTATAGTQTSRATRLEAVMLPVGDVDRAKAFFEGLGWRLDGDGGGGDWRVVQFTPPGSDASVIFGSGVMTGAPGSGRNLLAVPDIDAARRELVERGVDVGEVYHDAYGSLGGGFHATEAGRASGPDPENRSYATYASFFDPDGNEWVLQQITARLPGRVEVDIEALGALLLETAEHHDPYEKSTPEHDWWNWYAPYFASRQQGATQDEAVAAADAYMQEHYGIERRSA